jgi:hypothetical protein
MPFKNTESQAKTYSKNQYLRLNQGTHTIRILDKEVEPIDTHFLLGKYSIACLGEECPVCDNNQRILMTNPVDFRTVKGWAPRTKRWIFNVYDRSLSKICTNPECGTVIKKDGASFAPACPACGTFLTNVPILPANKVLLMGCGVTLADSLNMIEQATVDESGEPLGWTNFDIVLMVSGAGKEKKTTPIPTRTYDKVEIPEDERQDTSSAVIRLTAGEIIDLLKMVPLKDIYNARKAGPADVAAEGISKSLEDDVEGILS